MVLTAARAEWMKNDPTGQVGAPLITWHHLVDQVLACGFNSQDSDTPALCACTHRKCCNESQWIKIQDMLSRAARLEF